MTTAATLCGELKLPFFMNVELYFKNGYINECRLNVSSLAMTFLHSVSIMTVSSFCKKLILFKQAGII